MSFKTIATKLAAAAPGAVLESRFAFGELTLTVDPARIIETLQFLRDDPAAQFISIIDISGVDYPSARSASTSSTICCRRS